MVNPNQPSTASPTDPQRAAPRIGDLLIERGLITQRQMEEALDYQREKGTNKLLGEVLIALGFISVDDLVATLAEASSVPFAKISPPMVDPRALATLPRAFIESNHILPVSLLDDLLTVAVADFSNVFLIEDIERLSRHAVQIVAATRENIRDILSTLADDGDELSFDHIMEEMQGDEVTILEQQRDEMEDLESAALDSPVIKLVNHVIQGAVQERASDIHLEPDDGIFKIRYRIDGELFEKLRPPYSLRGAILSRIKIMAGMDIAERRIPQDGSIRVMLGQRPIELRVSTMPGKFGEKIVLRVIDKQRATLELDSLGLSNNMLRDVRDLISEKNGVILVTGPTGSGKSTTLYACLSEIANPKVNISTVEDPVEFNLYGINQFQVNEKTGFTFAKALRSLLRQDPDIIMVGEIRDNETAQIAIQAALTGHLVTSTLHTNDAAGAITRLVNMAVEPFLVAACLRGVLAQRLVKKLCVHCKEEATITARTQRWLESMFEQGSPIDVHFHGRGCARCRDTGYAGRTAIYELLLPTENLLEAISSGASLQALRRIAREAGLRTLRDDGLEKVAAGITSVEALLEVVARKGDTGRPPTPEDVQEPWFAPTRQGDEPSEPTAEAER